MASKVQSHGLCGLSAKWFTRSHPPPLPILPIEIIYGILLLLPVKSIAQYRCVCKAWNKLPTSWDFLKKHLDYSYRHHRLIVSSSRSLDSLASMDLEKRGNLVATNLDIPWKIRVQIITGSCNGLLCVLIGDCLFLWNPCTRQYKQLPPSPSDYPGRCGMFYGFGYDMSIDGYYNYKVVRGKRINFLKHGTRRFEVEVYTRKTNSWKTIQDFPCNEVYEIFKAGGTFINGFLHWLAITKSGKDYWPIIICFDLEKEKFGEVSLPNFEKLCFSLELGVLNGMLCVMHPNSRAWNVYGMKEYGVPQSWILFITIPSFVWTIPRATTRMPLYLMKNGELVMQLRDDKLLMYDPINITFKSLVDSKFGIESTTYVESLESP